MPLMCGRVRFNPKFVPDAMSSRLFGPGVIEVMNAKAVRARRSCIGIMPQQYAIHRAMCLLSGAREHYWCNP